MATFSERRTGLFQRLLAALRKTKQKQLFKELLLFIAALEENSSPVKRWQTESNKKGAYLQIERNILKVLRVGVPQL